MGRFGYGFGNVRRLSQRGPYLRLAGTSVAENSAEDTEVGTPSVANGTAAGPITISAQSNANWFKMASGVLKVGSVSPNFETNDDPTVTLTDGVLERTFPISVTNVLEVTLNALTLSASTATLNSSTRITLSSEFTGSPASSFSVVSGALPTGMSINASTGDITGTPTSEETASFTIRETNADATAPGYRDTALSIVVSSVPDGALIDDDAAYLLDDDGAYLLAA